MASELTVAFRQAVLAVVFSLALAWRGRVLW